MQVFSLQPSSFIPSLHIRLRPANPRRAVFRLAADWGGKTCRGTAGAGAAKAAAGAQNQTKAAKKKKWSKGKVKDKANNAVICDKPTYDRIMKEVPTFKMISQSVLIERMKINGSLARIAIAHLEKEGLIKPLIHHRSQLVYTRATGGEDA
ncbi:hypothetical protein JCM21900_004501 [Sporobolomyces salmonicolor]